MYDMTDSDNRRKHLRVPVRIPAGIYFKNRPGVVIDGEILDLSEGGAFVRCTTPISLGEDVLVEIRFAETSFVEGKTVYLEAQSPLGAQGPLFKEPSEIKWARGSKERGFGVEFVGLSDEKRAFLSKLVSRLAKLKNDNKPE